MTLLKHASTLFFFYFMAVQAVLGNYPRLNTAPNASITPLKLVLPIDCNLGENCYIRQYVNVAQVKGKTQDYKGGFLTNDNQSGTDFSLQTYEQMEKGVNVLAPADGIITAIKDNMFDHNSPSEHAPKKTLYVIKKYYCGNYIEIDHGKGWKTRLCHLRQHSIKVAPGQSVRQGQAIALVGNSGKSDAPYLHFQLQYRHTTVDPFQNNLWKKPIPYYATGVIDKGMSNQVMTLDLVKKSAPRLIQLTPLDDNMIAWIRLYGVHGGDIQRFTFIQPDGLIYSKPIMNNINKDYKEWFSYGGYAMKKSFANSLLGEWTVVYELGRNENASEENIQWHNLGTFHFTLTLDDDTSHISSLKK